MPEGGEAVAPVDFLSFCVSTPAVADLHLEDPGLRLRQPRRDLRLEAKTIRFEARLNDVARKIAPHSFVASLHVGEAEIGQHVRVHREELVADGVPEIEHAVWRAEEPRT